MKLRALKLDTRVRVIIDGVLVPTTVRLMQKGAISTVLWCAWKDFTTEHKYRGITSRTTGYHDQFLNRNVNIQIDIYDGSSR